MGLHSRRLRLAATLLTGAAANAVLATAQPAQETPQPRVFGVGVTLVAVPVFVTDGAGKSVPGLTSEDFEVEDAGKVVPIAAFQAIDIDSPAATESPEAPMRIAELPLAMQAVAPRQFLILIDIRFSPRAGLFFGRKSATAYVRKSLAPGDLVAVATTGPAGLRILSNFTTDHEYAARVIDGSSTVGTPRSDPLGFSSAGISGGVGSLIADPFGSGGLLASSGGGVGLLDAELAARDDLMQEAAQTEYRHGALGFLGDLEKLVQALSPLRGRKQIVLFSGGFAESAWAETDKAAGQPLRAKMNATFRAAGLADVVIHSVDLIGIQESIDLTSQTGPNGSLDTAEQRRANTVLNPNAGRGTLIALSANTGGRAIPPRGDFGKALGEVDEVSRHSYVIAFETTQMDGEKERPRRLKVRVKRPGLEVSHRPEYSTAPLDPTSTASVQMLAAEAISKGLSGGPLRIHLSTLPYRDREGQSIVHAVLQVDGPALSEAARGKELAVQVYGYAMSGGRVLDGMALNTSLDLPRLGAAVRSSGIGVLTAFRVSPGNVDLRFFVRAGSAKATGSIQRGVAVPAFAVGGRVVSAPMFLLPPAGRLIVPFQPQGRPAIKIPFYVGDDRFVPDTLVTLTSGRARDACVFVWRDREGSKAPFSVTGELIQSGQAPRPVRIEGPPRVVPDEDGFDRYVVTVLAPQAPAGAYTLRLMFVEPGTGRTTRTESGVLIEG